MVRLGVLKKLVFSGLASWDSVAIGLVKTRAIYIYIYKVISLLAMAKYAINWSRPW